MEPTMNVKETVQNAPVLQNAEALAISQKFTDKILKEFGRNVAGEIKVTDYQRTLIQGYFICIDRALKSTEAERVRKNGANSDHTYDNALPVNWNTVNLNDLALDLVHYARMGLDMQQPNMLYPIPFANKKKQNYDVTLMEGYNGIRYIAEKYAVDVPLNATTEVVYSTDKFKPIKKSRESNIENYEFEITNPFDRGTIIGGFAYLEFREPTKNKLVIMSMKDIEKRKPAYASAEFWGGKKKGWENGKRVEVDSDGWLDEMVKKTLIREAYSAKNLPRDPRKIDDAYQHAKLMETRYAEAEAQAEIDAKANAILIEPETGEAVDINTESGEVAENAPAVTPDF